MDTALQTPLQPDVQRLLDEHSSRELLRLVVVGSVDDGKSTLIGRLLYECDGLFEDGFHGAVVVRGFEEGQPGVGAIQHVIDVSCFRRSHWPAHGG